MFPKILLCKIGSYLPIADICRFLCVCKGLDCELFWMFVFQNNIIPNFPLLTVKRVKNYKKKIHEWFIVKIFEIDYLLFGICTKDRHLNLNYINNCSVKYLAIDQSLNKINYLNLKNAECIYTPFTVKINQIKNVFAPNLTEISLNDCGITVFEKNYLPNLITLCLGFNFLKKIDLSGFPLLEELDLRGNPLENLDLSPLKIIEKKYIYL